MMPKFRKLLGFGAILISLISSSVYGQGCSDAGFCSAGSLQANSSDSSKTSFVSLKTVYGLGEQSVNIIQVIPEIDFRISSRSRIQASFPFVFASGNLGSNNGAGDLMLSYTYGLPERNNFKISFTAGTRLPTGKTNVLYETLYSYPMPYQTGLGTFDFILGASANFSKMNVALGLQKVLVQDNKNTYLHNVSFDEEENAYFESNQLKRGDDVLLRVGRLIPVKKVNITPGILMIYRLQEDKIKNQTGNEIKVDGSDGLTLNLTGAFLIPLNTKLFLLLEAGAPVIVREVRPDGLTRSAVISGSVRYQF